MHTKERQACRILALCLLASVLISPFMFATVDRGAIGFYDGAILELRIRLVAIVMFVGALALTMLSWVRLVLLWKFRELIEQLPKAT